MSHNMNYFWFSPTTNCFYICYVFCKFYLPNTKDGLDYDRNVCLNVLLWLFAFYIFVKSNKFHIKTSTKHTTSCDWLILTWTGGNFPLVFIFHCTRKVLFFIEVLFDFGKYVRYLEYIMSIHIHHVQFFW